MKSVTRRAYARAGLLGNPSDGYHGKTISFAISQYWAEVALQPDDELVLDVAPSNRFKSIEQLRHEVAEQGYYGAERILKAAVKRFFEYCEGQSPLHEQNFRLSFSSSIPRQVGLAGSSAIITATLRALMAWYSVSIPPHLLASLTLSVEQELGIPAGLQDRVIQAFQGLVYMDFAEQKMQSERGLRFGEYETLSPGSLSNVYVAFAQNAGQPTEVLHNDLRERYMNRDPEVLTAMQGFAELAVQGKQAIGQGDMKTLSSLIDQNFDQRAAICDLHPFHTEMVERARYAGASAKFCGSGGAIVGIFPDASSLARLTATLKEIDCVVFEPTIQPANS